MCWEITLSGDEIRLKQLTRSQNKMESSRDRGVSTRTKRSWIILVVLFIVVMILTMLKDWWLTSKEPNVWFYLFVPALSILGGVLSMYAVAKIRKQTTTFFYHACDKFRRKFDHASC